MFSIITITRNNLAGLRRTQASIAAQTSKDFEWIVIDGDSTDGTAAYLSEIEAMTVSEPDGGIYDAMNKGMACAGRDYLFFLNAGDALAAPETLQSIQDHIGTQRPGFIYGDAFEGPADGPFHLKKARSPGHRPLHMFTNHQSMMYRRDIAQGLQYDTTYRIAADYDFTVRFLQKTNDRLYCPFSICRFETGGISQQNAALGRREQFTIRERNGVVSKPINAMISGLQAVRWTWKRAIR